MSEEVVSMLSSPSDCVSEDGRLQGMRRNIAERLGRGVLQT